MNKDTLKVRGIVSMKTNDQPKIMVGSELMGSHQVTFDLYDIDPSTLMALVGQELEITFTFSREKESAEPAGIVQE